MKKAKGRKKPLHELWTAVYGSRGPYNVSVAERDCGAIYLGPEGTVLALSFSAPAFALQNIVIPDAWHTCANYLRPKEWDQLHLAGYGDEFNVNLRNYVGFFQSATPGKAARFVFAAKRKKWGPGDWEASDSGN